MLTNNERRLRTLLSGYSKGIYTLVELLPAIAWIATPDDAEEVYRQLPCGIQSPFRTWIIQCPLQGGIQIRDSERPFPIENVIALKRLVAALPDDGVNNAEVRTDTSLDPT